jgi:hypothetical protein
VCERVGVWTQQRKAEKTFTPGDPGVTTIANITPDEEARKLEKMRQNFGRNGMYLFSGVGLGFRGRGFKSESDRAAGIELRTRWIIALWLPLIPLGSYRIRRSRRVAPNGGTKRVLELFSKEPLAWRQIFGMWSLTAAGIVLMVVVYCLSW